MAGPGFEPTISTSEVDSANHYYTCLKFSKSIYATLDMQHALRWDKKKWVLVCPSFGECTARVKLDLTDFKKCDDLENAPDFSKPYLVGTELTSG